MWQILEYSFRASTDSEGFISTERTCLLSGPDYWVLDEGGSKVVERQWNEGSGEEEESIKTRLSSWGNYF